MYAGRFNVEYGNGNQDYMHCEGSDVYDCIRTLERTGYENVFPVTSDGKRMSLASAERLRSRVSVSGGARAFLKRRVAGPYAQTLGLKARSVSQGARAYLGRKRKKKYKKARKKANTVTRKVPVSMVRAAVQGGRRSKKRKRSKGLFGLGFFGL